ncbi:MAG TPA: hypothetical protein VKR42_04215 [Ktedonobacteraceae bacterium]|nr:hypothetical protein [Ktedonobacteraceae bacterium]
MDRKHSQPALPGQDGTTCPAGEGQLSRRSLLKLGAFGLAASTLGILEEGWLPHRLAHAAPPALPDIQYDIKSYLAPAQTIDGVLFQFGPVHSLFLTAQLTRTPTKSDQKVLADALNTIESTYSFSPGGLFSFISYGLPYFNRLPSNIVSANMPRLLSNKSRYALEEAVPGPTDVSPQNPGISKENFNVYVVIESNDVLFTFRSDVLANISSVEAWLQGSNSLNGKPVPSPAFNNLFTFTSARLMFLQMGTPATIAKQHNLPYASQINNKSPMWMSFSDGQVAGSGPAKITTFQGNSSAVFTTTKAGDYFYDGSIQHLSHIILDMEQFYQNEPYYQRCQYMFRSNPVPSLGYGNQYKNGGGPTFLPNKFQGTGDAEKNAEGINTYKGKHRLGHLTALQRSSRASDNTPIHIRMDGPGYDTMDVPFITHQPKTQFTIFVPTADFFATMRINQASLDLASQYNVSDHNDGLERFLTATRRQNFLIPPRAHRAFPLLELS